VEELVDNQKVYGVGEVRTLGDPVEVQHMLLEVLLMVEVKEQRIKDIEGEMLPNLL
jgi:hypothetical protein